MGMAHHGSEPRRDDDLMKRFIDQVEGKAKRVYEQGRMRPDDDGALAAAITADPKTKRIVIDFGKPITWLGLTAADANNLINILKQKIGDLGEPVVITVGCQPINLSPTSGG